MPRIKRAERFLEEVVAPLADIARRRVCPPPLVESICHFPLQLTPRLLPTTGLDCPAFTAGLPLELGIDGSSRSPHLQRCCRGRDVVREVPKVPELHEAFGELVDAARVQLAMIYAVRDRNMHLLVLLGRILEKSLATASDQ
eukprot:1460034-Pyramimonas_sp.AAC.1